MLKSLMKNKIGRDERTQQSVKLMNQRTQQLSNQRTDKLTNERTF